MKLLKWTTWSWKLGRIRGVEIRLHVSILLGLIITYFIFHPTNLERAWLAFLWLLGFLVSIFLHEVGHAWIAKLVHAEVKSIVVWLLGGFTTFNREPEKPLHRLAIYAAGPLMSLVLGAFFLALFFYLSLRVTAFTTYVYLGLSLSLGVLNIVLFIFNILPAYPLDGGQILHALSEFFFGKPRANLITMVISIPVLIGLIIFGIRTHDYILLFFCILIAFAIGTLNARALRWMNLGLNYIFKRAGYYFMQGDYDRAASYCSREIKRRPNDIHNYLTRAICYVWMLRQDQALADLEHASQMDPKNAMGLLLRADLYAMNKNYDAALDLISLAQETNPNWGPVYIDRGTVLLRKNELQNALEEFNKGISLIAQVPLFYIDRSMVHFRLGDLEAAHKDQDVAFELSEKDALTRPEFNLQTYEGFLDWTEDYCMHILAKQPRSWRAYQVRADAYRVNHEPEKAIADYTQAIEINPQEPLLYLGRGRAYTMVGDIQCATTDFRHAFDLTKKAHLQRQAEELLASLERQ